MFGQCPARCTILMVMKQLFRRIAHTVSNLAGSAMAFGLAVLLVAIWALTGPAFGFSDTWQLVINTGTTIVTFLMVFLIQNTQNRDSKAMQIKLDELLRATRARDSFIDIEEMSDEELALLNEEFQKIRVKHHSPALDKFHHKLASAHSRRKSPVGQVADQVVSLLNHPLGGDNPANKPAKK